MASRQDIVDGNRETGSGRGQGKPRALRLRGGSRRPITIPEILAWVDEHRRLTGRWPRCTSGRKGLPIGETWVAIQSALNKGYRGLEGGSSLAQLLAEHRDLRGPLTPERILGWADAHHAATGRWPTRRSGRVAGSRARTGKRSILPCSWAGEAYLKGRPAAPAGRGTPVRNVHTLPRLTLEQVLAWADAYHAKTGRWPRPDQGGSPKRPARPGALSTRPSSRGCAACRAERRSPSCRPSTAARPRSKRAAR